jgi:hypothetical protein
MVCHTCDTPPCVNPAHLFVGTAKDNAQDCSRKNRINRVMPTGTEHWSTRLPERIRRGVRHPDAKLTQEQATAIRRRAATGLERQRDIGRDYGVSQTTVWAIAAGLRWPDA